MSHVVDLIRNLYESNGKPRELTIPRDQYDEILGGLPAVLRFCKPDDTENLTFPGFSDFTIRPMENQ